MKHKKTMFTFLAVAFLAVGGGAFYHSQQAVNEPIQEEITNNDPVFNADSAYFFVEKQCSFGARTMNSEAHELCGKWLVDRFSQYGCAVTEQKTTLKGYDGTKLKATNIIAKLNPKATNRVLICAHWDSRPWADNDPNKSNWNKSVMGADDGASGIGVMLELARVLQHYKQLNVGVDFVCFDAEDWGTPQWINNMNDEDTWALGAQYWAKNLSSENKPMYGILLDMVGGKNAKFYIERASMNYASSIVNKVWGAAAGLEHSNLFVNELGGSITDDHIPVNEIAQIPTVDIIPYYNDPTGNVFGPYWHTINDTMANISPNTLKAVGQTLLRVLCAE